MLVDIKRGSFVDISQLGISDQPGNSYLRWTSNGVLTGVVAGTTILTMNSTGITTGTIIGGTAVGSTLVLRSTSGVGTTDAIIFQVGNNGATEAGRFFSSGNLAMGSTTDRARIYAFVGNSAIGAPALGTNLLIEASSTSYISLHSGAAAIQGFYIVATGKPGTFIRVRYDTAGGPIEFGNDTDSFLRMSAGTFACQLATTITTPAGLNLTLNALTTGAVIIQSGGTEFFRANNTGVGFFAAAPVAKQTSGENLTNNVTVGGVNGTIADFTDLAVYANDSGTIRNDIYQLARKLKQANDALRLYGLLT